MIILMTLGYIACVIVAFKVIKLKVSPTTVAAAVVGGCFLMGGILIVWKQSAPMTEQMVLRRHVLQIVPDTREFVSKVHVKGNQTVKKGDPLFEITPDRFQRAVEEATGGPVPRPVANRDPHRQPGSGTRPEEPRRQGVDPGHGHWRR